VSAWVLCLERKPNYRRMNIIYYIRLMARVHSIFVQGRGAHNGTTEILYFLNSKSSLALSTTEILYFLNSKSSLALSTTEILYFLNSKSSSRIKCSKLHATHQFHNAYHLALSTTEILYFLNSKSSSRIKRHKSHTTHQFHNIQHNISSINCGAFPFKATTLHC